MAGKNLSYFVNADGELVRKVSLKRRILKRLKEVVNGQSRLITFLIISHIAVQGLCVYGLVDAVQHHQSSDQILVLISISTLLGIILTITVLAGWLSTKPKSKPQELTTARNELLN